MRKVLPLILWFVAASTVLAQGIGRPQIGIHVGGPLPPLPERKHPTQPSPEDDPISYFLMPPGTIMGYAQELGLQENQRATITAELVKAQTRIVELQWDVKQETEKMARLLQQIPADELRVVEQADKIMMVERSIKKTHLSLLIRIRNVLTPDQIARLKDLRRSPW